MILRAVIELIETDPPLPTEQNPLSYPTSRKAHITFGRCATNFLIDWQTFGGVAEENMESAHAVFNQLKRRFAGCRGKRQKKLVFEQYLYSGANFIRSGIDEIKEGTRAMNPAKKN